ncbi:flagellar hook-length control protein FliK [Pseudoalteromonas sp. S2755]|uniref:flagellar hook-length control protein FliK n=1 Tax=Pseudoalteromonas sp. S2755 TaxID=2066523 RepID=UPI00110BB802|nr:flagellar hook-length control protein FliK [Pseudoalteromonas sp. S2755]TMN34974.1 flagellar hook-length control protein FliK [Pseudoalteromonas sp. S2755]
MNKLPITTNTTTASVISTDNSEVSRLDLAKNQPFAAKNIQISNDKLKMDVAIDGRWQTIQLALKPPTQPNQLPEAQVSIDETGKVVTFQTPKLQAQVTLTKQLFDILTTLKTHTPNPVVQSSATTLPDTTLHIKALDLKVPLPQAVAQLLASENKLIAHLNAQQSNVSLQVVNQFKDLLFNTALPKSMIAKLISSQLSSVEIKPQPSGLTLKINDRPVILSPISSNWPAATTWQKGEVKTAFNGIDITKPAQQVKVETIKPLSALLQQVSAVSKEAQSPLESRLASVHTLAYDKPLFEVNLQQIKSTVAKALQVLIGRPFGKPLTSQLNQSTNSPLKDDQSDISKRSASRLFAQSEIVSAHNENKPSTPLQQLTNQIKLNLTELMAKQPLPLQKSHVPLQSEKLANSIAHYLQQQLAATPKYQAPPVDFEVKQKALSLLLDTLTGKQSLNNKQVEQLTQVLARPLYRKASSTPVDSAKISQLQSTQSQGKQITATPSPAPQSISNQIKGIIEALLTLPMAKPEQKENTPNMLRQASATIEKLVKADTFKQAPELQKLVNQAFTRLLDDRSVNALTVKNQLESQLGMATFTNTPTSLAQSSFTQMLERLIVSLLGSQVANQVQSNEQAPQKIQALLDALLPQLKQLSPKQTADALQQPQAKELLNELGQLHNQLQPQQSHTTATNSAKQDSEAQLIVNLLFPTKVGQEQQQTQLQIGEYKKSPKPGMPEKSVWFIRLCFDFAEKGQIHAQAELMDKALECALVATSSQVKQLAEPHLAMLRHKLASHGLQVAEIGLREEASFQDKFFNEHAIINIKV